jgi:hypothetical protein
LSLSSSGTINTATSHTIDFKWTWSTATGSPSVTGQWGTGTVGGAPVASVSIDGGSAQTGAVALTSKVTSVNGATGTAVITVTGGTGVTVTGGTGITPTIAATTAYQRRVCTMVVGADNGSLLANADLGPQLNECFVPAAGVVVEIEVSADAGTPSVIVQRNHLGTATALLSSVLATSASGAVACSNTGGTTGIDGSTTCSSTLQNTSVAAGDWFGLTSGVAGVLAHRMTISVVYTLN